MYSIITMNFKFGFNYLEQCLAFNSELKREAKVYLKYAFKY